MSQKHLYESRLACAVITNNTHFFESCKVVIEVFHYNAIIAQSGGIDLQLLGLGHNGHIGFNEPADVFPLETNCVDLQASTIEANKRFFESEADVPRQAYTMGIGNIMQAKKIVVVVSGKDKAKILRDVVCGPITPRVPASVLQLHPDVTIVADEAALSLLDAE
jgi:glucosamine-6-phosphate deaminase